MNTLLEILFLWMSSWKRKAILWKYVVCDSKDHEGTYSFPLKYNSVGVYVYSVHITHVELFSRVIQWMLRTLVWRHWSSDEVTIVQESWGYKSELGSSSRQVWARPAQPTSIHRLTIHCAWIESAHYWNALNQNMSNTHKKILQPQLLGFRVIFSNNFFVQLRQKNESWIEVWTTLFFCVDVAFSYSFGNHA